MQEIEELRTKDEPLPGMLQVFATMKSDLLGLCSSKDAVRELE